MQHRPKPVRLLAMSVVMAMVIAACTSANPESTETTAAGGETTTSAGTDGTTTAPEASGEKPVIVAALGDTVNIIEPHTFRSTAAYAVTDALYEPLLEQVFEEQPDGLLLGAAKNTSAQPRNRMRSLRPRRVACGYLQPPSGCHVHRRHSSNGRGL